jgi:hypothetical protein
MCKSLEYNEGRQIKAKKGVRLEYKLEIVRRIEAGERQVGVRRV